jgi:Primosomal protein N C-terminal domain
VRGPVEAVAAEFSKYVAERLHKALGEGDILVSPHGGADIPVCHSSETSPDRQECLPHQARVLGPAPCPFARLRGKYRFQIQVQGPEGDPLRAAVAAATADLEPPDDVQWIVDVDPVEML